MDKSEKENKETFKLIKNYKTEIILILIISLLVLITILSRSLSNLDEIWNYNLSRNIAEGRTPYKDFNMVQTPGMFLITGIILRICNELITTRILGVLLTVAIMIASNCILRELKVSKYISAFITCGITYLYKDYFILDYNFLNLLLILTLIIIEYKSIDKHSWKINILIGLIAGFTLTVKQTTGAFIILSAIITKLVEIRKNNKRQILKELLIRMLGISIPIILLAVYLLFTGALNDFIDYTILGISTFNNKIEYKKLIYSKEVHIKVLSILAPLCYLIMAIHFLVKGKRETVILLLYGVASFVVVYPISDNIHFLIGVLPAILIIISAIYKFIENLLKRFINKKVTLFLKYISQGLFYILSFLIIIQLSCKFINVVKEISKYKELNHFKYIPISSAFKEQINDVNNYLLKSDKPIYILDANAAVYMIPINRYNKDYDMFLKGNLGGKGENGQIEKIKNMSNTYILILSNPKSRNWQTPTKVIEYVENNLEKIDNIRGFDVYTTN